MDSYDFIDTIQVEKARALAKYKQFNNISKLLRLIEVFFATVLISWSSSRLPTVFKVFTEYVYACSSYVLNQHVVFLLGNVIVVLCYVLSTHTSKETESESEPARADFDDNKYIYVDHVKTSDQCKSVNEPVKIVNEPVKITYIEEIDEKVKVAKSESEILAIKQAAKQMERFKRTQSARLRRDILIKPRKDLRRCVTDTGRIGVRSGGRDATLSPSSSFAMVERLSNEEFRLAVEAFISKQQKLLKQEIMVEE